MLRFTSYNIRHGIWWNIFSLDWTRFKRPVWFKKISLLELILQILDEMVMKQISSCYIIYSLSWGDIGGVYWDGDKKNVNGEKHNMGFSEY